MAEIKNANIAPIQSDKLNKDAVIELLMADIKTLREIVDKQNEKINNLEKELNQIK